MTSARGASAGRLTRQENVVLSCIYYLQPATAYRIRRSFAESITGRLGASAGGVYAIVHRLVAGGFVERQAVPDNARGAELLSVTAAGYRALRQWVGRIDTDDLVIEDPVRTKMLAIDMLDRDEAIAWIVDLVQALEAKVDELEQFDAAHPNIPHRSILHDNARSVLITRLEWARRTLQRWNEDVSPD